MYKKFKRYGHTKCSILLEIKLFYSSKNNYFLQAKNKESTQETTEKLIKEHLAKRETVYADQADIELINWKLRQDYFVGTFETMPNIQPNALISSIKRALSGKIGDGVSWSRKVIIRSREKK